MIRAGACLSLTGRFAPFGTQAANGLRLWAAEAGAELVVVDDESEPTVLEARLPELAANVDLLFGPYSTILARAAAAFAQRRGLLLFNHGGSGGRLNIPGCVVNILTPADRYASPFVAHLAKSCSGRLFTYCEIGQFGRQVTAGAGRDARAVGIAIDQLDFDAPPDGEWDLLSAGVYEDDVAVVNRARALPNPPRLVCSVAAGVASFADDVDNAEGVFGVGQWTPGAVGVVEAGMDEREFLRVWEERFGGVPDYPGVQAYAAGVIAAAAGPGPHWDTVAALDLTTVFGRFRIDAAIGEQTGHTAVLTRWRDGRSLIAR
ncbi:ABC transporter substrate-binding protein [Catenulispora pinisilvae]|uniref:ABC transporter substrate-binding protein n=1 Tax=Catenulispora pinisilvae TaxID=2705253 RepID=UPI001892541C|nr:ABC transporter substrate-binding protein [Catenulispora pinisilvae]